MRLARLNPGFLDPAAGASTISKAIHDGKIIRLNALTGHTLTLPPALGSQCWLRIVGQVAATSNSNIIKVANTTDIIIGGLAAAALAFAATDQSSFAPNGTTHDTVTLNRTTTGGAQRGEYMEFLDVASGLWLVSGFFIASATPATPFSATV